MNLEKKFTLLRRLFEFEFTYFVDSDKQVSTVISFYFNTQ